MKIEMDNLILNVSRDILYATWNMANILLLRIKMVVIIIKTTLIYI